MFKRFVSLFYGDLMLRNGQQPKCLRQNSSVFVSLNGRFFSSGPLVETASLAAADFTDLKILLSFVRREFAIKEVVSPASISLRCLRVKMIDSKEGLLDGS